MEEEELQRRFGLAVRRRRLLAKMGQEKLADTAKIHRTHVSLIERGQGMPTLLVLHKLAAALGATMAELLGEVESPEPPAGEPEELPRGRPPHEGRDGAQGETAGG